VPMDKGAMPVVQVLAMRKGNIAVGFFASEHNEIRNQKLGANYLRIEFLDWARLLRRE
jgi:hypothetical protein